MKRSEPPRAYGLDVLCGAVSLALGKVIPGILLVIGNHEGIARHLGHDGRCRDRGDARVPLDEALLGGVRVNGVPVNEDAVGLQPNVSDGARNCLPERGTHPHGVDRGRLDVGYPNGERNLGNLGGKGLPAGWG